MCLWKVPVLNAVTPDLEDRTPIVNACNAAIGAVRFMALAWRCYFRYYLLDLLAVGKGAKA